MIYPLKYIASSITKYATANSAMCNSARTSCWARVGRGTGANIRLKVTGGGGRAFARALGSPCSSFISLDVELLLLLLPLLLFFGGHCSSERTASCRIERAM